jgi:Protein of unknown function (DUF1552)
MTITKMALPRRTFLRGIGAALALPLLDAMIPVRAFGASSAAPVKRLGFIYIPNGASMSHWKPQSVEGTSLELSPSLKPLEALKEYVVVPTGLTHHQAESLGDGNGEHSRGQTVWLSGVHPKRTEGADVRNSTTVDQLAAQVLGKDTPLMSLELALEQDYLVGNCDNGYSCTYWNTVSWRTPTTPLPMEVNPRVVFERLFGDGGTAAERLAEIREDRSILDWVTNDINRLQKTLGGGDRTRVSEYLDAIREVERRIQAIERQAGNSPLALPDRPIGVPESYDEYAKLMFDLQALAFQADITRVFTMLLGREQSNRPYPQIGVPDAHHAISHHQKDPAKLEKAHKINTYHVALTAYFLERLRSTPDGDGTLLDHTMIMHGGGISDADQHSHIDLPCFVAGGGTGKLKGGRLLEYPLDTPMSNLHLALLDKVGVHVEKFGDSTGEVALEPLVGV